MKSKEEVKEYLENHFFKNRRHAYAVRNALIDIDELTVNLDDLEVILYQWANIKKSGE